MDLSKILKYYEQKINLKIDDDDVFLKAYDKNPNSIFERSEFEKLKKDLSIFAKIDFNEQELADNELLQLYNSKVDEKYKEYDLTKFGHKLIDKYGPLNETDETGETGITDETANSSVVQDFIDEDETLTPEEEAICEKYLKNEKYADKLSAFELKEIANLNEKSRKIFDEILEIAPDDSDIIDILIFSLTVKDEHKDYAKSLITKGIAVTASLDAAELPLERRELLNKMTDEILETQKSEKYDPQQNRENVEQDNEINSKFSKLLNAISGSDEKFKNFTSMLENAPEKVQIESLEELSNICGKIENKNFDKIIDLFNPKSKNYIRNIRLREVAKLNEDDYKKAKELYNNPDYEQFDVMPLMNMDESKRQKIVNYFKNNIKDGKMNLQGYYEVCGLNDAEFERFEKIKKLKVKNDAKLPEKLLIFMAEANDDKLNNFIKEHPDYSYLIDDDKKTLAISKKDKEGENSSLFLTYSQNGNYFEFEEVNTEIHRMEKVIKDNGIKKSHKIKYTRIPSGYNDRTDVVSSQEIETFDSNGSLLKKEKYEPGQLPGVPNVTEIDSNGNEKILQKSTKDKNGTTTVQKDFLSPDGTRTYVQSIEDKFGNTRSIYKITDKDGNVLLDRTQTFTILSENRFQSSLNGHSFDITYTDEEIVIKDMQSDKVSKIPLKNLVSQDKNKEGIINILKNMSAQQLLVMKLNNINNIQYSDRDLFDNENVNNAFWRTDDKNITLGKNMTLNSQEEFVKGNFAVFCHEYGHYIDSTAEDKFSKAIYENAEINKTFKKELEAFLQGATTEEEHFIDYFTGSSIGDTRSAAERVAETNMLLYSNPDEQIAARAYYLQRYFPKSIAMIAAEIAKIEQKAIDAD